MRGLGTGVSGLPTDVVLSEEQLRSCAVKLLLTSKSSAPPRLDDLRKDRHENAKGNASWPDREIRPLAFAAWEVWR